jgi:hypothetical protein
MECHGADGRTSLVVDHMAELFDKICNPKEITY